MMMLKTIKNYCDDYFARYVSKAKDLLRKLCNLSDSATLFFLGNFYFGQVFLCKPLIFTDTELKKLKTWLDINKLTILLYWTQEKDSSYVVKSIKKV